MTNSQPVEISNRILYLTTFVLLLLVLPTGFIHEKTSRILFYWCGYLSLIGLIFNALTTRHTLNQKKISLIFLSLACLFLVWSAMSKYLTNDTSELLFTPGKRWLVSAAIALYILNGKSQLKLISSSKVIISIMAVAFIAASAFGIYQGLTSDERILLGINRATLTAYAYSAFALSLSSLIAISCQTKYKYILQTVILVVSTYVVFLTQTRSAMFIHPVLGFFLLLSWMYKDKLLSVKILTVSLLSLIIIMIASSNIILNRYDSTLQEITEYNRGNDNTSLGARFSMWKLGLIAFSDAPFGQSESQRNNSIINYLQDAKEQSAATQYLTVHLHNEFIQYASIFGIFGILVLFSFFFMLIFKVSQPAIIGPVGISTISILLYGATDVLLSSIELIVIFSTTIILSSIVCGNKEKGNEQ